MTLERTAHAAAGNGAAGCFCIDSIGVANRDVSGIGRGFHVAGFDNEDSPAALGCDSSGNRAGMDLSGCGMELRIAANVADFQRSTLAPYFRIAANIAGFDGATLGNNRGFTLDLS